MQYFYKGDTFAIAKTEQGNIRIFVEEPDNFGSVTVTDRGTIEELQRIFTKEQYIEGYNKCIEEFVGMFKNLYGEEEWNKAVSKWKETL